MKLETYVKRHWDSLPKSTFDGVEVVIVQGAADWNEGYGNHGYEGWGVNKAGEVVWCYSSGCSCQGNCGVDHPHEREAKALLADKAFAARRKKDWDAVDWASMAVEFNSY